MPSARRVEWAKFRVAATAFSALLILGVLVALLTGGAFFQAKGLVRVFVTDAAGLGAGSPVRLNGIPVGAIEYVQLTGSRDPNRVVVVVCEIEQRYLAQIPADSVATVTSQNLQGDRYLDITRGHGTAVVKPGGEVRFQPASDALKSLDLAQFQQRLRAIDVFLAEIESGKGPLGELIRRDSLYQRAAAKVAGLEKAIRTAASTQEALGRLLYRDTLYEEIRAPVVQLDQALARIERGEGEAGKLIATSEQYDRLRRNAAAFRQRLAALNAGQDAAGRFLKSDDLYAGWNRRVGALIASVDALQRGEGGAARLMREAHPYESLNGMLGELRNFLADFRGNPRKFMRLSLF